MVFLLNSLQVGGSEKKMVALLGALHRRGWPVHLIYLNPPHTLLAQLDPGVPRLCLERRGKLDWRAVRTLGAYMREHGVGSIHCVNRYPMLYGYLVAPRDDAGRRFHVYLNSTRLPNRVEEAKMLLYRLVLRRARRVVFGCRFQQSQWLRRYRLPPERCTYIYNGVDTARFDPLAAPRDGGGVTVGRAPGELVLGMVGQCLPKKGYPDYLHALARLRAEGHPVRGLVVGDGPERARLQALAQSLGVPVHWAGELSDVRPALLAMDIFLLTSVASETFSNAALEAMAMGLPVVLSRLGGAAEMVEEGVNGHIYPAGDVERLVARLRPLVTDPRHRARLAAAARPRVQRRFGIERMIAAYEQALGAAGMPAASAAPGAADAGVASMGSGRQA
ncbi:glycosyltransferase family 4 protein [Alkalilimnicola sp. S0819]|uniref:glycosyltransferase family 4 protein n=1 Tax=Alkalilimnicola sp. S0819 TaxID=2613922 RepID=UPI00186A9800|nr:glycosyltransferase family 4 protein [Alkalilimnicola sp. S0819]